VSSVEQYPFCTLKHRWLLPGTRHPWQGCYIQGRAEEALLFLRLHLNKYAFAIRDVLCAEDFLCTSRMNNQDSPNAFCASKASLVALLLTHSSVRPLPCLGLVTCHAMATFKLSSHDDIACLVVPLSYRERYVHVATTI